MAPLILALASCSLIVGVAVVALWRYGLWGRQALAPAMARAEVEAREEIDAATGGAMTLPMGLPLPVPPAPVLRPLVRRPQKAFGTRRNADRDVLLGATALLEAQALENGALERMVDAWGG